MGSRKDIIKRCLGITEYPWSSDDELEEATLAVEEASLRRPPMEPLPSASNASGSNALPVQQLPQQQQLHQLHQSPQALHHHRQQLHHQQQLQHLQHQHQQQQQHRHGQQQNVEQQQQQQHATFRRNQARQDRNQFWSFINLSHQVPMPRPRSNSSDRAMSFLSRVNHVPAAELPDRPAPSDIQRMLAFKRLTRNLGSMRHRGHATGVIPMTRVNPGVIVPSEANSSIRIDRLPIRRFVRTGPCGSHPRNSPGQPAPAPEAGAGGVAAGVRCRSRARDAPDGQDDSPREPPPALARNSDDEVNNNPHPPTEDPIVLDEGNVDQDMSLESEHDVEASDNSGANVALDEQIVAIDLDNSDIQEEMAGDEDEVREVHASTSAAAESGPTAACFPADYQGPGGDPTVASTSGGTSDADPQQSESRGVKRSRRDSNDSLEPYSVKDFNQNLLRLLECPVCLEWMEPPMSQCRRGHLVCGRCRARLVSCPVCRTTFSSVRNRAMEGVAEMLRYPCRHNCGREVRLRRRAPHEASCAARKYQCPASSCAEQQPMPRAQLAHHFQPDERSPGETLTPVQGGEEILLEPDYVPIETDELFSSTDGRLPAAIVVLHSFNFANQRRGVNDNEPIQHPWLRQSSGSLPFLTALRERALVLANELPPSEGNNPQRASGQLPLQQGNDVPTSDSAALPSNEPIIPNLAMESRHLSIMKIGRRHKFSLKVNSEQHDNWLIMALEEYFHLRIDVDIRTWGVVVYVSYIGPKRDAKNFTYEVTIDGQHNQRKLVYARTTHSDLESSSLNVSRQDCFHLTLDQALNFIRFKNRHCNAEKFLDFNVEIGKVEQPATPLDESDS